MANVHAPRLELFHRGATVIRHLDQGRSEGVGRVLRQLHHRKSVADALIKRGCGGEWLTRQPHLLKPACFRQPHLGLGEQRIRVAKELFRAQICYPCRETFQIGRINRHKHGVDVLGGLGVHFTWILEHLPMKQVDMFEPEGRRSPHPRAW